MNWFINLATNAYILVLISRWLIELIMPQYENTGWFLKIKDITEPLLNMIRNMVPKLGNFDISYIVAIIGIRISSNIITWIL